MQIAFVVDQQDTLWDATTCGMIFVWRHICLVPLPSGETLLILASRPSWAVWAPDCLIAASWAAVRAGLDRKVKAVG